MRDGRKARAAEFEALYRTHRSAVRVYASARVGHGDVDDIVSATFMTVWQRLDAAPQAAVRAWVLGVCRNHCRNTWRSERRFAALVQQIEHARPRIGVELEVAGVAVEAVAVFQRILPALSTDDRELLVLVGWLELTPTEIADVLGIAAGTVRVRLHRLRSLLSRELQVVEEPGST